MQDRFRDNLKFPMGRLSVFNSRHVSWMTFGRGFPQMRGCYEADGMSIAFMVEQELPRVRSQTVLRSGPGRPCSGPSAASRCPTLVVRISGLVMSPAGLDIGICQID